MQIAGPQGTTCRGAILAAARVPVLPQLPDKLLSEYSFQSSLPGPVLISVDLAYTARVAVAYTFKVDVDTDPPR